MEEVVFLQWSRTICQVILLAGVGVFLFTRDSVFMQKVRDTLGVDVVRKIMRSRALSLEPSYIPVKTRRGVLKRDNYKCVWCGKGEEHDVSHLIQKQAGGQTYKDNLVTTCGDCKRKRHYDSPREFIDVLKLEKIDIHEESISMFIKVYFVSGRTLTGEVATEPSLSVPEFYLKTGHNGNRSKVNARNVDYFDILGSKVKGGEK